jgi:hypothetical protein
LTSYWHILTVFASIKARPLRYPYRSDGTETRIPAQRFCPGDRVNGLVRYTLGTADNGLSVTGMVHSNKWNSTD